MVFFFFQAEDGIRDKLVTGVQTCALPISDAGRVALSAFPGAPVILIAGGYGGGFDLREWVADVLANTEAVILIGASARSGERRGGEEGRSRGSADPLKKKSKNQDKCIQSA